MLELHQPLGVSDYNTILKVFNKVGFLNESNSIFKIMKELEVDKTSYELMLVQYSNHGLINEVFDLYEEVLKSNIPPTYNMAAAVVDSCVYSNDLSRAEHFIDQFKKDNKLHQDLQIHYTHALMKFEMMAESDRYIENNPSLSILSTYYPHHINKLYVFSYQQNFDLLIKEFNYIKETFQPKTEQYDAMCLAYLFSNNTNEAMRYYGLGLENNLYNIPIGDGNGIVSL